MLCCATVAKRWLMSARARRAQTEVSAEQKEALRLLLRAQPHPKVTPEIRRELFSCRSRGDPYLPHLAGGDHAPAAEGMDVGE